LIGALRTFDDRCYGTSQGPVHRRLFSVAPTSTISPPATCLRGIETRGPNAGREGKARCQDVWSRGWENRLPARQPDARVTLQGSARLRSTRNASIVTPDHDHPLLFKAA
jgi:hypothetical protein